MDNADRDRFIDDRCWKQRKMAMEPMESFVPSFWRSASEGVCPVLKGRVEPSRSLVRCSPITLGSFLLVNSSGKTSGQYWSAWDTGTRRSCILRSCTLYRAATSGSNEQKNRERKIWECQMLGVKRVLRVEGSRSRNHRRTVSVFFVSLAVLPV